MIQFLMHTLDGHLSQVSEVLSRPRELLLLTLHGLVGLDDLVRPRRHQRFGSRHSNLVLKLVKLNLIQLGF